MPCSARPAVQNDAAQNGNPMRAFIALNLPQPVVLALTRLQEHLPVGRPVPPENLHLTLAFLDDQPDTLIGDLHLALQGLRAPGFDLELAGLGTFGGRDPRVIFVSASGGEPMAHLHAAIRSTLRAGGLTLGRERFRPHVTLARLRPGLPRADLTRLAGWLTNEGGFRLPPFPVDHFALYRSILRSDHALHEELARYPLG